MTKAVASIAAGAAALGGTVASVAQAQTSAAGDARRRALEIVAALEEAGSCTLSLHGAPQRDDITERWLIAYSGVGPACDDTGAALQREGLPADIVFYRRPNADELTALIGRMRASVRRGFACLIAFNGEPRFDDESNLWTVRYSASGHQCSDAAEELERQGKPLGVIFQRFR